MTRCRLRQLGCLLAMTMAFHAHGGTYRVAVSAGSSGFYPGPIDAKDQTVSTPSGIALNAVSTYSESNPGGPNSSSSISLGRSTSNGFSKPGAIRLQVTANSAAGVTGTTQVASGTSSAYGYLNDTFLVSTQNCPTCTAGSRGSLTFAVDIAGSVTGGGAANGPLPYTSYAITSQWTNGLSVQSPIGGASDIVTIDASGTYTNNSGSVTTGQSGVGLGVQQYQMSFTFGIPISLQWNATVSTTAGCQASVLTLSASADCGSSSDVNFSNTFGWAGILAVRDSYGQSVASYSALSADGINYVNNLAAIPEPASMSMASVGLLLMLLTQRRRLAQMRP